MCGACAHARTHTYKPQAWSVQDVKREKKEKKKKKKESLNTSIWSGSAESFTKTEVEKKKKEKKNTLKHKVWLLRNASSQSVRTTGCIQGSRENKHWRKSFLHTWCLSQPQIPKFARDAAKPIHSRLTCDFYLIRVWILWTLGCLYMCVYVSRLCARWPAKAGSIVPEMISAQLLSLCYHAEIMSLAEFAAVQKGLEANERHAR